MVIIFLAILKSSLSVLKIYGDSSHNEQEVTEFLHARFADRCNSLSKMTERVLRILLLLVVHLLHRVYRSNLNSCL